MKEEFSRAIKEKIFLMARPKTTDLFFDQLSPAYISPNDHVLIVGPGIQSYHHSSNRAKTTLDNMFLPMDRSLMVLPPYLASGNGTITVMDHPKAQTSNCPHEVAIMNYVKRLKKIVPICPITYINGDLKDPTLKTHFNERFNFIIDHLTTYNWVLQTEESTLGISELSRRISSLYQHILSSRGKALIFYILPDRAVRKKDFILSVLKKAFHVEGFTIRDLTVIDRYEIPRTLQQSLPPNQKFLREDILDIRKNFVIPAHSATGVLIAQKS